MKKLYCILICLICVFSFSVSASAEEILCYEFETEENLNAVTNTLSSGGTIVNLDGKLVLDGTYGLKLGEVTGDFTVSAMISVSSTGGTNTIFFKDMDQSGNKWTGVLSKNQKPSFWTHGDNFQWATIADGDSDLSSLNYVTYCEKDSVGTLYVNGTLIGSGNVAQGDGTLYLGVTYWTADAIVGYVDSVKLYNHALTENEILEDFENSVDYESVINIPNETITNITLPTSIATKTITWTTSDETVIDTKGNVTRCDIDKTVTLTAYVDGEKISDYEITVLKSPSVVNDDIILSYEFNINDKNIIHDISGNGNHGEAVGNLSIGKDGAIFDGIDDYVKMPEGLLCGHDEITIVMTLKPDGAQKHVFAYGFGNGADIGYMFLNPSRPDTNYLRFAMTKSSWWEEQEIVSLPGVRHDEWATIAVVISDDGYAQMYVDGDLVMDGDLGVTISDLGEMRFNYIAKSLYDGDPYFKGTVREFTIFDYAMDESKVKKLYGNEVEYADDEIINSYITGVSFENGINIDVDTFGRDDVKIGAVVLDENNNVIETSIVASEGEIKRTKDGTICVFAFDEEHNVPSNLYVMGNGDGFSFAYTPGVVSIVSDTEYTGGTVIVAGYDVVGTLTGTAIKKTDLKAEVSTKIEGDFVHAVTFKLMYWDNLNSMTPIE